MFKHYSLEKHHRNPEPSFWSQLFEKSIWWFWDVLEVFSIREYKVRRMEKGKQPAWWEKFTAADFIVEKIILIICWVLVLNKELPKIGALKSQSTEVETINTVELLYEERMPFLAMTRYGFTDLVAKVRSAQQDAGDSDLVPLDGSLTDSHY